MKITRPGKAGLSRIELICIILLIAVVAGIAILGATFYKDSMSKGDDGMKARTCEKVATVNLLERGCVVSGCDGTKEDGCIHNLGNGITVGYYDDVEKKVFEEKSAGYNEFEQMKIGKTVYKGDVNTMIIRVEGKGDKVKLSWVKGSRQ